MPAATESNKHLYELLKGFDNAMLVTHAGSELHARPMAVAKLEPDADMFFSTSLQSPKAAEIDADSAATVTFQDGNQFASVSGNARIVRDRQLIDQLWSEAWRVWFPGGKDDPSLCLIRLEAQHGEYWDTAGAQGVKYAFRAAKAYLKGEIPDIDKAQNSKVRL